LKRRKLELKPYAQSMRHNNTATRERDNSNIISKNKKQVNICPHVEVYIIKT